MQEQKLRQYSHLILQNSGYLLHEQLPPLLDIPKNSTRTILDIHNRIHALYAFFLFLDGGDAYQNPICSWLEQHQLWNSLTPHEQQLLSRPFKLSNVEIEIHWQAVEALFALCWVINKTPDLDFNRFIPNDFSQCLPVCGEQHGVWSISAPIQPGQPIRSQGDILQMLDIYYCLHWATIEEKIQNVEIEHRVPNWVIQQRRYALEWVLSQDTWENVNLDT